MSAIKNPSQNPLRIVYLSKIAFASFFVQFYCPSVHIFPQHLTASFYRLIKGTEFAVSPYLNASSREKPLPVYKNVSY